MKPLIIVSHNLSFTVRPKPKESGEECEKVNENVKRGEKEEELERENLANGVGAVLSRLVARLDDAMWVGWLGEQFTPSMPVPESSRDGNERAVTPIWSDVKSSQVRPVFLGEKLHSRYLSGMCANCLWPLLHSMSTYAHFSFDNWQAYVQANTEFARVTLDELSRQGVGSSCSSRRALIWIHDYHLMSMPLIIRRLIADTDGVQNTRIAFSLHTPFPTWDLFRLNPWSRDLLAALLGAHLVVFLTHQYAANFLECCARVLLTARVDRNEMSVEFDGRYTLVRVFHVGFDFEWFERAAVNITEQRLINADKTSTNIERIILSIDRLDYTKGLIERVLGYERLLEKYPDLRTKTVLYQLVTPLPQTESTDPYRTALKSRLEREIARICGRFATASWTPIRYICHDVSQHDLISLYSLAAICVVAPIRDGASQVAKEFVASASPTSVLVMSALAASASDVLTASNWDSSTVVFVNPLESDLMADGLKTALDLSLDERRSRMATLKASLRKCDIRSWINAVAETAVVDVKPTTAVIDQLVKIPTPIMISFVERQKNNVKSAIEMRHHDQEMIVKSVIKNIV